VIEVFATDSLGNASAVATLRINVTPLVDPPITVSVTGARTGGLCPQGPTTGDAEFNGGPEIQLDAELRISPARDQLLGRIVFRATETNPGQNSEVRSAFERVLYTAPAGQQILSVQTPTSFSDRFVGPGSGFAVEFPDCQEGPEVRRSFPGGLVRETRIVGDTPAADISSGPDCRCSTRINDVVFHDIQVLITAP
jgi:hypothetical protein